MATVQEILTTRLGNIKRRIAENMVANGRNVSGRSVASLQVEVNGDRGTLFGSSSFLSMERGRKAGKVPKGFTSIIKQWIIDKGISFEAKSKSGKPIPRERALNSFAGAVAYTIMKKGTKMKRENVQQDIFSTAIKEELDAMAQDLSVNILEQITTINESEE